MIGHRSSFRENDDLPLRRGPVVKKKPPFSFSEIFQIFYSALNPAGYDF